TLRLSTVAASSPSASSPASAKGRVEASPAKRRQKNSVRHALQEAVNQILIALRADKLIKFKLPLGSHLLLGLRWSLAISIGLLFAGGLISLLLGQIILPAIFSGAGAGIFVAWSLKRFAYLNRRITQLIQSEEGLKLKEARRVRLAEGLPNGVIRINYRRAFKRLSQENPYLAKLVLAREHYRFDWLGKLTKFPILSDWAIRSTKDFISKIVWILTGGGDCPGLNPYIAYAAGELAKDGRALWGILNGFEGAVAEDFAGSIIPVAELDTEEMKDKASTDLYASRLDPFALSREIRLRLFENLSFFGLLPCAGLIVVGGNDHSKVAGEIAATLNLQEAEEAIKDFLENPDFNLLAKAQIILLSLPEAMRKIEGISGEALNMSEQILRAKKLKNKQRRGLESLRQKLQEIIKEFCLAPIPVIGIPKSIDGDFMTLPAGLITALRKAREYFIRAMVNKGVMISEIMGRLAGWLALAAIAKLSGRDSENQWLYDLICQDLPPELREKDKALEDSKLGFCPELPLTINQIKEIIQMVYQRMGCVNAGCAEGLKLKLHQQADKEETEAALFDLEQEYPEHSELVKQCRDFIAWLDNILSTMIRERRLYKISKIKAASRKITNALLSYQNVIETRILERVIAALNAEAKAAYQTTGLNREYLQFLSRHPNVKAIQTKEPELDAHGNPHLEGMGYIVRALAEEALKEIGIIVKPIGITIPEDLGKFFSEVNFIGYTLRGAEPSEDEKHIALIFAVKTRECINKRVSGFSLSLPLHKEPRLLSTIDVMRVRTTEIIQPRLITYNPSDKNQGGFTLKALHKMGVVVGAVPGIPRLWKFRIKPELKLAEVYPVKDVFSPKVAAESIKAIAASGKTHHMVKVIVLLEEAVLQKLVAQGSIETMAKSGKPFVVINEDMTLEQISRQAAQLYSKFKTCTILLSREHGFKFNDPYLIQTQDKFPTIKHLRRYPVAANRLVFGDRGGEIVRAAIQLFGSTEEAKATLSAKDLKKMLGSIRCVPLGRTICTPQVSSAAASSPLFSSVKGLLRRLNHKGVTVKDEGVHGPDDVPVTIEEVVENLFPKAGQDHIGVILCKVRNFPHCVLPIIYPLTRMVKAEYEIILPQLQSDERMKGELRNPQVEVEVIAHLLAVANVFEVLLSGIMIDRVQIKVDRLRILDILLTKVIDKHKALPKYVRTVIHRYQQQWDWGYQCSRETREFPDNWDRKYIGAEDKKVSSPAGDRDTRAPSHQDTSNLYLLPTKPYLLTQASSPLRWPFMVRLLYNPVADFLIRHGLPRIGIIFGWLYLPALIEHGLFVGGGISLMVSWAYGVPFSLAPPAVLSGFFARFQPFEILSFITLSLLSFAAFQFIWHLLHLYSWSNFFHGRWQSAFNQEQKQLSWWTVGILSGIFFVSLVWSKSFFSSLWMQTLAWVWILTAVHGSLSAIIIGRKIFSKMSLENFITLQADATRRAFDELLTPSPIPEMPANWAAVYAVRIQPALSRLGFSASFSRVVAGLWPSRQMRFTAEERINLRDRLQSADKSAIKGLFRNSYLLLPAIDLMDDSRPQIKAEAAGLVFSIIGYSALTGASNNYSVLRILFWGYAHMGWRLLKEPASGYETLRLAEASWDLAGVYSRRLIQIEKEYANILLEERIIEMLRAQLFISPSSEHLFCAEWLSVALRSGVIEEIVDYLSQFDSEQSPQLLSRVLSVLELNFAFEGLPTRRFMRDFLHELESRLCIDPNMIVHFKFYLQQIAYLHRVFARRIAAQEKSSSPLRKGVGKPRRIFTWTGRYQPILDNMEVLAAWLGKPVKKIVDFGAAYPPVNAAALCLNQPQAEVIALDRYQPDAMQVIDEPGILRLLDKKLLSIDWPAGMKPKVKVRPSLLLLYKGKKLRLYILRREFIANDRIISTGYRDIHRFISEDLKLAIKVVKKGLPLTQNPLEALLGEVPANLRLFKSTRPECNLRRLDLKDIDIVFAVGVVGLDAQGGIVIPGLEGLGHFPPDYEKIIRELGGGLCQGGLVVAGVDARSLSVYQKSKRGRMVQVGVIIQGKAYRYFPPPSAPASSPTESVNLWSVSWEAIGVLCLITLGLSAWVIAGNVERARGLKAIDRELQGILKIKTEEVAL
ncbi:MAG: 6-phosphofructokinase, partial [Candidatus Omnitrophota bacterium]